MIDNSSYLQVRKESVEDGRDLRDSGRANNTGTAILLVQLELDTRDLVWREIFLYNLSTCIFYPSLS